MRPAWHQQDSTKWRHEDARTALMFRCCRTVVLERDLVAETDELQAELNRKQHERKVKQRLFDRLVQDVETMALDTVPIGLYPFTALEKKLLNLLGTLI